MKNKNFIFYPNMGLNNLLFSYTEKDIIPILGEPQEMETIKEDENEYEIRLFYRQNIDLFVCIYYENGIFDRTTFFIDNLILDNVRFSDLSKNQLIEFIKSYHLHNGYEYKLKFEFNEDIEEEYWNFVSIGLTIWFEGEDLSEISDICVSKIIEK